MASNITKVPLMRNILNRSFATVPKISEQDIPLESSTLGNKLQVLSLNNGSNLIRVSVVIKAGSRYETADNIGVTNVLRSSAGLTTKGASTFAITRTIQEHGANLYATNDRDTISYTLECLKKDTSPCLRILACVAGQQVFKPWELSDNIPRLKYELAQVPPQARVLDMLHGAAYRTGLGNSLFLPKFLVGSHGSETLQHYVQSTFSNTRAVISCVGNLSHTILCEWGESLDLGNGSGPAATSTYYGGELRKRGKGIAHVAVATEGAGINKKEALAFAVLQHALGTGPGTKRGNNSSSPLAKAVAEAAGGEAAAVSALNTSHLDSGLFGLVLACEPRVAGKVTEAAVKALRSCSVTEEAVKRGKANLKAVVLEEGSTGGRLLEDIGQQTLLNGCVQSPTQTASAIDSISSKDVSDVARKVSSGKLSIAAMGDISNVPFLDQLK